MNNLTMTWGECLNLALEKQWKKVVKREVGVLADVDVEELHQMRVGLRRFRSFLQGFSEFVDLPVTDRSIRDIARVLGCLRDIDVLLIYFNTKKEEWKRGLNHLIIEKERKALKRVIYHLKKERSLAFKRVKKCLKSKGYREVKTKLQKGFDQAIYSEVGKQLVRMILPDFLLRELSNFFLHPGWFQENNTEDQSSHLLLETLHDLRKKIKKLRYLLELFDSFYGDDYREMIELIKMLQSLLGEMQDQTVFLNYLHHCYAENLHKIFPHLVREITDNQQLYLLQWEELKQEWIEKNYKSKFYQIVQEALTFS